MSESATGKAGRKRRIHLLGVPVDLVPPEELDDILRELLKKSGPNQVVFLRTLDLLRARRRPHFKKCLEDAALVLPVSMGLKRAAESLHLGTVHRHFPFAVIIRLLNLLEEAHGGMYILGDRTPYTQIVEKNLKQTFPAMRILGRFTGSYPPGMQQSIITAIAKASPNVLLCGDGLKGQNLWIHRHRKMFPVGIQVWSAECFDYFTARRKRPCQVAFRRGHEYYRESNGKPWKVLTAPMYLWYKFLVLKERVFRAI